MAWLDLVAKDTNCSSTIAELHVRHTGCNRRADPNIRESVASIAVGLYVMSAAWGVLHIAFPDNGILYFASALLFAGFATGWAIWDAKARGIRILPVLQMLYFFLWPIGAVIYLIYRSGKRGLVTSMIHGIGLVATLAFAFYTTFYGLHFAGMLDPRYYKQ